MDNLEVLLTRLASQTDTVLQQWVLKEGEALTDEGAWLALEQNPYARPPEWECGYQVQIDESTHWILVARGATPTEAATNLERMIS